MGKCAYTLKRRRRHGMQHDEKKIISLLLMYKYVWKFAQTLPRKLSTVCESAQRARIVWHPNRNQNRIWKLALNIIIESISVWIRWNASGVFLMYVWHLFIFSLSLLFTSTAIKFNSFSHEFIQRDEKHFPVYFMIIFIAKSRNFFCFAYKYNANNNK